MDTETKTYKLSELYPDVAAKAAQRLHIKKDEIPLVRKYFVSDKDSVKVDEKERSVVSRISCVNVDRDGDSLLPSGVMLDNYKRNPIVCWSHSYSSPEQIIGKNIWIKPDDQGLIAKTAFANNDFADQVYRAYTEDVGGTGPLLRGWSVGFIPIEYETPTKQANDGPKRIYTKWELLEYSAVAVPCSPESLTMAYAKGIITSEVLRKDLGSAPIPEIDTPVPEKDTNPPTTDSAVQPRIDLCETCGTALGVHDNTTWTTPIVTKPETTEAYHRIPVSDGHGDHEIRTITVSAKDGIKGLYCIPCKEIFTYLFDVDKWTMEEAKRWIEDHKKDVARLMASLSTDDLLGDIDMKFKEAPVPDLAGGMASIQAGIDAILARLPVVPEPVQVVAPLPAPPPIPVEQITIEAGPDIEIEPSVPEKSIDEMLGAYIRSGDYKRAVNEAVTVALAKIRGRVI